ncbi:MAG: hypothetical protein IH939_01800 [Acidobacteria bacterium]|nr:hypothetical protein [Acidobacteriota bacterium]
MTDAARAFLVAAIALAIATIRLSVIATTADPASPQRLIAELRLAQFAALLLVLTAGVYIGFALAHESTTGSGLDVALGVGFLVLASVAISQSPRRALTLLAIGFAGHAVVDLLHGARVLPAEALPNWYATACAIYDVAIAAVCYLPIVRRP